MCTFTRQTFKIFNRLLVTFRVYFPANINQITERAVLALNVWETRDAFYSNRNIKTYQQEETLKVRPLLHPITSLFRRRYIAGVFCHEKCLMIVSTAVLQGLDLDKCDLLWANRSFSGYSHLIVFIFLIHKSNRIINNYVWKGGKNAFILITQQH